MSARAVTTAAAPAPAPPRRVAATTFGEGLGFVATGIVDGGFGYFTTAESTGQLVKVRLSDLSVRGVLAFEPGEVPSSAFRVGNFGYFGMGSLPGRVVKVRLSDMTRVGAVTLNRGDDFLLSAVTDGTFGYFGTGTSPGRVVKVRLSNMTRVGSLTLRQGEEFLFTAITDGTFGYFGGGSSPGRVVKVRLSDMTRAGALTFQPGETGPAVAVSDGTFGYFATSNLRVRVLKVRLSNMNRVGAVTLGPGESGLRSAVTDGTFGYFGTGSTPSRIVKVRLSNLTRIGALQLRQGEGAAQAAVVDGRFAFFGLETRPGSVVKVEMNPPVRPSAPTKVKAIPSNRQVQVRWAPPDGNGGAAVTGYRVQRSTDGRNWTTVADRGAKAKAHVVTGLRNGDRYRFRVLAKNRVGFSNASTVVSATPRTVPGPPVDVRVTSGPTQATVTWSPPTQANNGGSAVRSYQVQRSISATSPWTTRTTLPASARSFTVKRPATGSTQRFRVVAVNAAGPGAPSKAVSVRVR